MRKNRREAPQNSISILTLDDDPIFATTIQSYFQRTGYVVDIESNPITAIETIRHKHYDILMLDYLMSPICGDQVVERVREFNTELYIIMLTGHKNLVPPVRTVRQLDIQGYCEKSDKYDQLEMLVESCVKSIKQLRVIRDYQAGLSKMAELLPGIYSSESFEDTASKISAAVTALWDSESMIISLKAFSGDTEASRLVKGEKFEEYRRTPLSGLQIMIEADQSIGGILSSQLVSPDGTQLGYIAVSLDSEPDQYRKQLFDTFIRQCSSSLENMRLTGMVRDSYLELVRGLRIMVDARDKETRGHSDRVGGFAADLARSMGCSPSECERIRLAGQFHDIGKVSVPDSILFSKNGLTPEEVMEIKKHPGKGASILSAIPSFAPIVPIVRAHHEKYDGSGYPDGLAGKEIPLEARIIAVCDAFDAMISQRRYSTSISVNSALNQIRENLGTQFDPEAGAAFIRLVESGRIPVDMPEKTGTN